MDKKIAGLLGAVAGLATVGSTQAMAAAPATQDAVSVRSYADLLEPVPNALEALKADDAVRAQGPELQLAQYHHHHHHHRYRHHHHHHHVIVIHRRHRHWHHHHHHHHSGAFIGVPGVGGVVVR